MLDGTTNSNENPQKPLMDIQEMIELVEKAKAEREERPEAMLMCRSLWEKFRDLIDTPGKTAEGRRLLTDASARLFNIGLFSGMPVFVVTDLETYLVEKLTTSNVILGKLDEIQKAVDHVMKLRPKYSFKFEPILPAEPPSHDRYRFAYDFGMAAFKPKESISMLLHSLRIADEAAGYMDEALRYERGRFLIVLCKICLQKIETATQE